MGKVGDSTGVNHAGFDTRHVADGSSPSAPTVSTTAAVERDLVDNAVVQAPGSERPKQGGLPAPGVQLAAVQGQQRVDRTQVLNYFRGKFLVRGENPDAAQAKAAQLADYAVAQGGNFAVIRRMYDWYSTRIDGADNTQRFAVGEAAVVASIGGSSGEVPAQKVFASFWIEFIERSTYRAAEISALAGSRRLDPTKLKEAYRRIFSEPHRGSDDAAKFDSAMEALRELSGGKLPPYPRS